MRKNCIGTSSGRNCLSNIWTPRRRKAALLLSLAAPVAVGWAQQAHAASLTWDSSGAHPTTPVDGSGNWDTTTSALWSNGTSDIDWVTGDIAIFGSANSAAGTVTIDDASTNVTVDGLTFNAAGSGNYTIAASGSDTLTLSGSTPTITVATGQTPTISANILGTNGMTFNGAGSGTLILGGANTYSGATTINSGELEVTSATGFGTSTVTVASGGMAMVNNSTGTVTTAFNISGNGTSTSPFGALTDLNRSETFGGTITLNANARIGNGGFTSTFSNPIAGGTYGIEFYGFGTQTSFFKSGTSTASTWGSATVTAANSGASVLFMTASNLLPTTAPLTLNATSTGMAELDLEGRSETVAGLASSGTSSLDEVLNNGTGNSTLTIIPATNMTFAGSIVPGGTGALSLNKSGAGMETFAGANTYTGTTTITTGILSVTGSLPAAGTVTIQGGGTLSGTGSVGPVILNNATTSVIDPGPTGPGSVGTLTLASLTTTHQGHLQFDLNNASVPSNNDSLVVTAALTFTSASVILPSAGAQAGIYTILTDSAGITYTASPVLTTPTGIRPGTTYTLAKNSTNMKVTVVGGAIPIWWNGSGLGDGTTWGTGATPTSQQNWADTSPSGTADYFYQGDLVNFADGASTNSITLSSTVLPGSVTFTNNSSSFTLSGTGSIGGIGSLTASGSGTEIIGTTNNYSGGSTISNGTLTANAASALGTGAIALTSPGQLNINNAAFGSGTLTINSGTIDNTTVSPITLTTNNPQIWAGSFTFAGTSSLNMGTGAVTLNANPTITVSNNTLTIAGVIANGTGTSLTKAGAGTLVQSGVNTYNGTTNVSGGILQVTNNASLGLLTGSGVNINGGTVDLGGDQTANNINFGGLVFTIASPVSTVPAITNSNATANGSQFNAFASGTINLSGNALISGNRIDIGRTTASTLNLNGYTLTLSMSGAVPEFGIENNTTVTAGNIVVVQNTLDIEQNAQVLNIGGTITYDTGTNAQFYRPTAGDITRPMVFDGSNVIGSDSLVGTVSSNMTLLGNVTLEAVANGIPSLTANNPLILAGNITESGGSRTVTKTGVSTMTLSGSNAWTGGTIIQNGTLQLGSSTGLPSGTAVTFGDAGNDSGILDLDGNNATVGGLSVIGTGTANTIGNSGSAPSTLTFATGTSSYSGVIKDILGTGTSTVALTVSSGNLTLTGSNTYTGGTILTAGKLVVANTTGSATGTDSVTLNGGTLASGTVGTISGAVTAGSGSHTIAPGGVGTVGTLTLSGALTTSNLTTINFDLGAGPAVGGIVSNGDLLVFGTAPTIASGTALSFGGTPTTGDDYRLIGDTTSGTIVSGITLSNFALPTAPVGDTYALSNSVDPGYIDLVVGVVASGPANLTWDNAGGSGDGSHWDTTNQNWLNGSTPSTFSNTSNTSNGDNVTFNDTNNGHYNVTVNSTVTPNIIAVNSTSNTSNYNFSGTGIIGGGGGLTMNVSGSVNISNTGPNAWGSTTVNGGTLNLGSQGALPVNQTLTIASGASVVAVNHSGGASSITVLQVNGLANSGTIDLTNNDLVIHSTSGLTLDQVTNEVKAGYNGGAWNGTGGAITSSMAANPATNDNYLTAVGVATGLSNTNFENQGLTIASSDIVVKYTYYGDANLDGGVDGSDYTLIDNGFNTGATGWQNGDFNYDGVVDGSDYTLIDNAYNTQGSSLGTNPAALIASATDQIAGGTSAVPEPTTLGLLGIGAVGLLARRRRRNILGK